jgi:hypothetical protein
MIFAIPAAAPAIPPNPKTAAMRAMINKAIINLSIAKCNFCVA